MSTFNDCDLYRRGMGTLLASWEEYARGAVEPPCTGFRSVAAAVFPHEPERAVYNNTVLKTHLVDSERPAAVTAMEVVYTAAGVDRFAAWVHERDEAMRLDLERRGYTLDTTTRAMVMSLDDITYPGRRWSWSRRTGSARRSRRPSVPVRRPRPGV